jgi:3-oxoacyl-[acyl-carrier protein] reductase
MDLEISGRHAVVCASTAGLGEAVARALAAEGARVVICGRRGDRARAIAAELPEAIGVPVDLQAPAGPARLVSAATEAFGPVDILVLNGPGPRPGGAQDLGDGDIVTAAGLFVRPHQQLVSLVLPAMRDRGWGRILAIGSSGLVAPIAGLALSNICRAALGGYLKTLAAEVAGDGITVNLLLPGRIATARTAQVDEFNAGRRAIPVQEVAARSRAAIPMGRYGDCAEFGAVAAFICGQPASYITGTALRCDGGLVPTL